MNLQPGLPNEISKIDPSTLQSFCDLIAQLGMFWIQAIHDLLTCLCRRRLQAVCRQSWRKPYCRCNGVHIDWMGRRDIIQHYQICVAKSASWLQVRVQSLQWFLSFVDWWLINKHVWILYSICSAGIPLHNGQPWKTCKRICLVSEFTGNPQTRRPIFSIDSRPCEKLLRD